MAWKLRPEVLLAPNIPKPLHGLAPRVVLGQAWWDKTRRVAYCSTNFRCIACGVHKYRSKGGLEYLEAHELYHTDYRKGRLTYLETVPLCHYCHNYIHDGRMRALLEQGKLRSGKFAAIIQHGNKILEKAGLQKLTHNAREAQIAKLHEQGLLAPWHEWRLVLFGREYSPLHATEDEWRKAYAND